MGILPNFMHGEVNTITLYDQHGGAVGSWEANNFVAIHGESQRKTHTKDL